MSRIGKKPILIPKGVEVKIEGQKITIKGPRGELIREIPPEIKVEVRDWNSEEIKKAIFVEPQVESKKTKAFWGLTRVLLANMVEGVTKGFEKKLQIEGIGYRAHLEGNDLVLYVGFSHPLRISAPPGIKFSLEKNIINVSGIDKELVGQIAAKIRKQRPPEPYKGKGIRYLGEVIRKKVGKKAVGTK